MANKERRETTGQQLPPCHHRVDIVRDNDMGPIVKIHSQGNASTIPPQQTIATQCRNTSNTSQHQRVTKHIDEQHKKQMKAEKRCVQ